MTASYSREKREDTKVEAAKGRPNRGAKHPYGNESSDGPRRRSHPESGGRGLRKEKSLISQAFSRNWSE